MITVETLCVRVVGLQRADVERWIGNGWLRPERAEAAPLFHEVDIARARLIQELEQELHLDPEALPVVLSLLDQLYETRRRMHRLAGAIAEVAPEEVRRRIAERLLGGAG